MRTYKKTFIGSIAAFFIGTSCCWVGTLAVWIGSVSLASAAFTFVEDFQVFFIAIGILLLILTIFLFGKKRLESSK